MKGFTMKCLVFIHGPNGVGKSAVSARLHQRLPGSAWLESEWCRMINPFTFTPEIELLTERQMSFLLRSYLECSMVEYVIFNWGLHGPRQRIFDKVLGNLGHLAFHLVPITLTCSEDENTRRMEQDGRAADRVERALQTRVLYDGATNLVIDTTHLSVEQTVERILAMLRGRTDEL